MSAGEIFSLMREYGWEAGFVCFLCLAAAGLRKAKLFRLLIEYKAKE